jgi:TPR repeat protein
MRRTLSAATIALALSTPAAAKEKCTSMCHFFDAWALTKVCSNLAFNEAGIRDDKDYGDLQSLKRQALRDVRHWPNACHPSCVSDTDDNKEGTVCQYLKERSSAGLFEDGKAAYDRGDYNTALRLYRPLVEQGNASAEFEFGRMYSNGHGVPQNFAEALKWFRLAADQGNVKAQVALGIMYYLGQSVRRNLEEARKWFRLAAEQGDSGAQAMLGSMYVNGAGVPKNYVEAMKWYRLSADQGDATGQLELGIMYHNGQGVPPNDAEAAKWLRLAAAQGNASARDKLAVLRRNGLADRTDASGQQRVNGPSVQVAVTSPNTNEVETLLIAAVERARAAYAAAANDMAKGAARPTRAKEICAILKDNLYVINWPGKVEKLSSNSDGFGVLSIQIDKDMSIKTWSNALSDIQDKTLIDPSSAIFQQAVVLKEGQKVTFGGQFIPSKTDCIREGSLTLEGSLTKPEFLFRFSNIAPAE